MMNQMIHSKSQPTYRKCLKINGWEIKPIRDFIKNANQEVDTASAEFRELTFVLAGHMLNNGGKLSADEYNYNVDHYNSCRLITGFISPTKLPQPFKDGLRRYYALAMIRNGTAKNETDELNWINWIPSGGTVVVSTTKTGSVWPKGTIISEKTLLQDLITIVHPQFPGFSAEAKERALVFIAKMNPYVKINRQDDLENDGKSVASVAYVVEKDQPVLIPLYKFIAE